MASTFNSSTLCVSLQSPKCYSIPLLHINPSRNSLFTLTKQTHSFKNLRTHKFQPRPFIFAAQSNFLKVAQTVWRVGKDGIEAGTNLVPDAIPRPIARISVTIVAVTLGLFALKSFLSTALFVLAMMGVIYFAFIALNKDDDGPKNGGGSTSSADDSLEEARRIMEKYK